MYCIHCGKENPANVSFCIYCGKACPTVLPKDQAVNEPAQKQEIIPDNTRQAKIELWVVRICLILTLGCFLLPFVKFQLGNVALERYNGFECVIERSQFLYGEENIDAFFTLLWILLLLAVLSTIVLAIVSFFIEPASPNYKGMYIFLNLLAEIPSCMIVAILLMYFLGNGLAICPSPDVGFWLALGVQIACNGAAFKTMIRRRKEILEKKKA